MDLLSSVFGQSGSINSIGNTFYNAINVVISASTLVVPQWPPNAKVQDGDTFDFVIVGAGSAGSVLAARLTEDPNCNVLLIEAGGDPPITSVIPGGFPSLIDSPSNWNYYSINDNITAQSQAKTGEIYHSRGKMLGGSSSLNYMFYTRGNPNDFNRWADAGFEGWDWDSVYPYFLKSEGMLEESILKNSTLAKYHNSSGPLKVSRGTFSNYVENKLDVFLDSLAELGVQKIEDYNGETQFGVTRSFFTHTKPPTAKRSSTAQSYLVPGADRPNLFVLKNAIANKIIIEKKIAVGVNILVKGKNINVYANKEVIVSCGAFNSPKLLVASGIGRKSDLERLNIKVVSELPVGDFLLDHPVIPSFVAGKSDVATVVGSGVPGSYNFNTQLLSTLTGFISTDGNTERPDIQLLPIYFSAASLVLRLGGPLVLRYSTEVCAKINAENLNKEIFFTYIILLHQKSRGRLEFPSVEPDVDPEIYNNYLTDPEDLTTFKNALKFMWNLTSTTYFKAAESKIIDPFSLCSEYESMSEDYLDCYVKTSINTLYHPVGTCAMGKVVDKDLKVYGVENLRVIDASVFPNDITSGNINAPVIMIAEKMSDTIKNVYENTFSSEIEDKSFLEKIFG